MRKWTRCKGTKIFWHSNGGFHRTVTQRVANVNDGTFINYDDGYQYYTEDNFLMKVHYPTNHFVSVVESGNTATLKGIFGYGSHATIDEIKNVKIECVKGQRLWCEIVHEKNILNDAKIFTLSMVRNKDVLRHDFSIDDEVKFGYSFYMCKFMPRYLKTFIKRVKYYIQLRRCL